jgi:ATP-dependent Clp protease ATP-binding subunit ClpA
MPTRFASEARDVIVAAVEETRTRGDRRIGTEHLLLGILNDPGTPAVRALGVEIDAARAALDQLDRAALTAIGLDVEGVERPRTPRSRKHTPMTSGARSVLQAATARRGTAKPRRVTSEHLLDALLACQPPDPAAALIDQLGVDRDAVRARLHEPGT